MERDDHAQEAPGGKIWVNINPDTRQTPCRQESRPPNLSSLYEADASHTQLSIPGDVLQPQLSTFVNSTTILLGK